MKLIYRIIGFAVVLIVLVAALLFFLNEKGYLKGSASEGVSNVKKSLSDIVDSIKKMKDDIKDSDHPIKDNIDTGTIGDDVDNFVHNTLDEIRDDG